MNISTKGRYGLRAMLDIAQNGKEKPVTLSAISARQDISDGYLEQLVAPLKKAGLVVSVRGAQGGYMLSRPAEQITVGEVFRALEGPIAITVCSTDAFSNDCDRGESCLVRNLWCELQDAMASVLDNKSLADLLPECCK